MQGHLAYRQGVRPRLELVADIDRLNLEAYLGDAGLPVPPEGWRELLQPYDAQLQLSLDRLSWKRLRLDGVRLDGRVDNGVVSIDEMSVANLAGASARIVGGVNLRDSQFNVAAEMTADNPSRIIRVLGLTPPVLVSRLPAIRASGTAIGVPEAMDVELDVGAGEMQARLSGQLDKDGIDGKFDLDLALDHPALRDLLRQLGILGRDQDFEDGPLQIEGQVASAPRQPLSATIDATIGPMNGQIEAKWSDIAPRPSIELRARFDSLKADVVVPILRLVKAELPMPRLAADAWIGRWPRRPLKLDPLATIDGHISLEADEVVVDEASFENLALRADLDDRRLTIEKLAVDVLEGRLSASGSLNSAGDAPELQVELKLNEVESAELLSFLGAPPFVEGPMILEADLRAAGTRLRPSSAALADSSISEFETAGSRASTMRRSQRPCARHPRALIGGSTPHCSTVAASPSTSWAAR